MTAPPVDPPGDGPPEGEEGERHGDGGPPGPGGPEELQGPPSDVGRWVTAAFLLFPLVAWGLAARLSLPVWDALYLAGLVALLPILAVAQLPLVEGLRVEREPAYVGSAVTVGVLGAVAAVLGIRRGGLEGVGLGGVAPETFALWVVGTCLAAAALVGGLHVLRRAVGIPESALLRELLPRTGRERRLFVALSLVAGVGEELAFRGYAIPVLAPHMGGAWGAAAFTSVNFGLLHAYQGVFGMVRTACLGFLLAASFVITGSLWPAVTVHVLLDLVAGLVLGERLTR